jgi:hypothetical protein
MSFHNIHPELTELKLEAAQDARSSEEYEPVTGWLANFSIEELAKGIFHRDRFQQYLASCTINFQTIEWMRQGRIQKVYSANRVLLAEVVQHEPIGETAKSTAFFLVELSRALHLYVFSQGLDPVEMLELRGDLETEAYRLYRPIFEWIPRMIRTCAAFRGILIQARTLKPAA